MGVDGQDKATSPMSHRLATISVAEALERATNCNAGPLYSDCEAIDSLLQESTSNAPPNGLTDAGSILEITGPSGSGKTTLAYQLAISGLNQQNRITIIGKKGLKMLAKEKMLMFRMQKSTRCRPYP